MNTLKQILIILICFTSTNTIAQTLPRSISELTPLGYEKISFESGDVNSDGLTDYVVAYKALNEDSISNSHDSFPLRPLIIYCMLPDSTYEIKSRNDNIIYCLNCGGIFGDPFAGLETRNGSELIVYHYGGSNWRWTHDIYFNYNQKLKTWILTQEIKSSYHTFDMDSTMETTTLKADTFNVVKFENFKVD